MTLHRLAVRCPPALVDEVSALVFSAGAEGLEERRATGARVLVTWSEDRELLERVATAVTEHARGSPGLDPRWARVTTKVEVEHSDWLAPLHERLAPVQLAPDLWLVPEHALAAWPDAGARHVVFRPALAFGDGEHETTRLAASALAAACRADRPKRVLDVGTGNGVLALVALRAGAASALGLDVEPAAIDAARVNAELSGLADRVTYSLRELALSDAGFDVVVANLELPVLLPLIPGLVRAVRSGGSLIMSGFLAERAVEVAEACAACDLTPGAAAVEGEWAAFALQRTP